MNKDFIVNIVKIASCVVGAFSALAMIKVACIPTAGLLVAGAVWYFSDKV